MSALGKARIAASMLANIQRNEREARGGKPPPAPTRAQLKGYIMESYRGQLGRGTENVTGAYSVDDLATYFNTSAERVAQMTISGEIPAPDTRLADGRLGWNAQSAVRYQAQREAQGLLDGIMDPSPTVRGPSAHTHTLPGKDGQQRADALAILVMDQVEGVE